MDELFPDTAVNTRRRLWRDPDFWAPIALVAVGILFFYDFLFSSKNFYFRDILNFHYPLRKLLIDSYARGEFPLWNPFIYLGQPMLANPNYLAFYPTNLLHLFLPFNYAFKLHFVLHPIAAGLGIYFLQRRIGLPPLPAFGGSLAYQFSGIALSFLNLYNILPAVALMPWIGWAFVGALRVPALHRRLLLALLLGLQVFAFEPLMFQCVLGALAGLALWHILDAGERRQATLSLLRTCAVSGCFAAGIAAIQIFPTLELLPRSVRGAGFGFPDLTIWSMHPVQMLNTIVPNLFGNLYTIGNALSWGESFTHGREAYLVSYFLGTVTVVLALLAPFSRRRNLVVILAGTLCASVFLALGRFNPAYGWLFEHVPLMRLGRYPSKYMLLGTLAVSLLAAVGLEVLAGCWKEGRHTRVRVGAVALLALVAAALFGSAWLFWRSNPSQLEAILRAQVDPQLGAAKDYGAIVSHLLDSIRTSGLFLLLSGLVLATAALGRLTSAGPRVMLLLLAAELLPANLSLSPLMSDADVSFIPEVNRFIADRGPRQPFRVMSPATVRPLPSIQLVTPNRSLAWLTLFYQMSGQPMGGIVNGIQYSLDSTVDYLNTSESDELAKVCAVRPEAGRLNLMQRLNTPMILALGPVHNPACETVTSFDTRSNYPVYLYWLSQTAPRAYFVAGSEMAPSPNEALRAFVRPDFDYAGSVILEGAGPANPSPRRDAGQVRFEAYENQRIAFEVDCSTAGHLVLLDSYYPGWRVRVDGQESPLLRANYAFRAVALGPGRHRVEFRYRPVWFYAGLAVSCASLAVWLFLLLRRRRRS